MLGHATTDRNGMFVINYTPPSDTKAVLYLIADGSSAAGARAQRKELRLATVLGIGQTPVNAVVNERTTVATAFAMAQFIQGTTIAGAWPGPQNAAATLKNLVSVATGEVGSVLGHSPNGTQTSTMAEFNSLSNLLAACVRATVAVPCNALFAATRTPSGQVPADTLQAAVNIAHYPGNRASTLFLLSRIRMLYQPALNSAPDAWTIAIRYDGNGHEFDGPGNMAIDQDGNVWSTNNYEYRKSQLKQVCGGTYAIKLTPDGNDAPGAPYYGGGLYGAGFGIALDAQGNAWLGNFGFEGSHPPKRCDANNTTVSGFDADGKALSQDGFNNGGIHQPQGMATDQQGNLWIANCGANSVVQYPDANPDLAQSYNGLPLHSPFGVAIDPQNNIWVTNNAQDANGNYTVVELGPDGKMIGTPFSGAGIRAPIDIAADSLGNLWVANSGILPVPCGTTSPSLLASQLNLPGEPSITEISPGGDTYTLSNFTGGGLTLPWGIAVDGNDNVWVANFGQKRLSAFCGARPENCPAGLNTGDPISPAGGYSSDGLTRNTGIVIDPSGNVWLANNWMEVPIQSNPGGREMVVFVGLAAPVKTPMAGPPRQP
ncbi:MAG TPA: NHL repeat-containing protein [Acidobacteriaceae bacterium]|nr:NHL repeat-containing protein [Acidobacteriaceae bacterium]